MKSVNTKKELSTALPGTLVVLRNGKGAVKQPDSIVKHIIALCHVTIVYSLGDLGQVASPLWPQWLPAK